MGNTNGKQDAESAATRSSAQNKGAARSKRRNFDEKKASEPVDELTKLEFEDWLYLRLTKFFDDLQTNVLSLRIENNEREDIGKAADEFLEFLFHETLVVDRRFRIQKNDVIKVGNFHEGLEIVCIDELNYCVVLEQLSNAAIAEILTTTCEDDIEQTVYLEQSAGLIWNDCVTDTADDKKILRSDIGPASTFFDRVAKAIDSVRKRKRATIYRKTGRLELVEVNGVSKNGTNTELRFSWNAERVITIVLTPVLHLSSVKPHIDKATTPLQAARNFLEESGGLLLAPIPETDDVFQWTFSHASARLLNNKVLPGHRELYRILLFFVQGYNKTTAPEAEFFTVGVLKTLVLDHDKSCGAKDQLADCLMAVIDSMQKLLKTFQKTRNVFLANYFHTSQNVMSSACRQSGREHIDLNLEALEQLANYLINEVGCTPLYDFDTCVKKLVPVNKYVLERDYLRRKYPNEMAPSTKPDLRKTPLIDAVMNKRFTVKFT